MTSLPVPANPEPGATPLKNPRHERFAQLYAIKPNGRLAYHNAGYRASDRSADANAARLLADARVRLRVAYLAGRMARQAEVDGAAALRRQEERGMVALPDYFEPDGQGGYRLRPLEGLTPAERRGLRSLEFEAEVVEGEDGEKRVVSVVKRIRTVDAIRADEIVMKSQGLLQQDQAQVGFVVLVMGPGGVGVEAGRVGLPTGPG